ncbi:MAG: thioredoxin family protein [Ignavibacteriales bacterium]|nr:thioredoxin family protein [Ignavibacteriales bacterium]
MNLVEVFVEENCAACKAVVEMLEQSSLGFPLVKRIYHREADQEEFQSRGITILPATFINRTLAFYGEFSGDDFDRQLRRLDRKS